MLENIGIILLYPKRAGNVGSTARVMKNFGLKDLVIVSKRQISTTFQAKKMAVHAGDILEKSRTVLTLKDAIGPYNIVIGTTGKFHKDAPTEIAISEIKCLLEEAKGSKIAFLFGPEDRGLSGEELSFCNYSLTIPTSKDYPSLNLSHAVAIICYELFTQTVPMPPRPIRRLANKKSLELLYAKMKDLYLEIGFLDKINPERIMKLLRSLYDRAHLDEREVRVLLGILKQTKWYIDHKSAQSSSDSN